jgi:hypothetical protein
MVVFKNLGYVIALVFVAMTLFFVQSLQFLFSVEINALINALLWALIAGLLVGVFLR